MDKPKFLFKCSGRGILFGAILKGKGAVSAFFPAKVQKNRACKFTARKELKLPLRRSATDAGL